MREKRDKERVKIKSEQESKNMYAKKRDNQREKMRKRKTTKKKWIKQGIQKD